MRKKVYLILCCLFMSCGGGGTPYAADVVTGSPPTLLRVDPAQGAPGSQVTIFGFGFSIEVANNVVIIGDLAVSASQYNLLTNPTNDELESITFTVPANLTAGVYNLLVLVNSEPSNIDQTFEVL
ncbi:MAG: IPT/TIG domain-containing protein [Pseudomonadota bacterium]